LIIIFLQINLSALIICTLTFEDLVEKMVMHKEWCNMFNSFLAFLVVLIVEAAVIGLVVRVVMVKVKDT